MKKSKINFQMFWIFTIEQKKRFTFSEFIKNTKIADRLHTK